ncbi:MAG: AraC family transcriptional regulator [Bacteroidota bacterium]|nr:AraC family transcriptional regulator [Bacteroidota bacterium]
MDAYNGLILVNKPGYEYTVTHLAGMPDECYIFRFKNDFYKKMKDDLNLKRHWFFSNENMQSLVLKTVPEIECILMAVLNSTDSKLLHKLAMESMITEMLQGVLGLMTDYSEPQRVTTQLKKNHLKTIELAKEYINKNFASDISLLELADHCCISPFHFSRIFKMFTDYSPGQYLQYIRLKHAELMLKTTSLPIIDIAFSSGFNSIDYFSSAFKKQYKVAPSLYRMGTLA